MEFALWGIIPLSIAPDPPISDAGPSNVLLVFSQGKRDAIQTSEMIGAVDSQSFIVGSSKLRWFLFDLSTKPYVFLSTNILPMWINLLVDSPRSVQYENKRCTKYLLENLDITVQTRAISSMYPTLGKMPN